MGYDRSKLIFLVLAFVMSRSEAVSLRKTVNMSSYSDNSINTMVSDSLGHSLGSKYFLCLMELILPKAYRIEKSKPSGVLFEQSNIPENETVMKNSQDVWNSAISEEKNFLANLNMLNTTDFNSTVVEGTVASEKFKSTEVDGDSWPPNTLEIFREVNLSEDSHLLNSTNFNSTVIGSAVRSENYTSTEGAGESRSSTMSRLFKVKILPDESHKLVSSNSNSMVSEHSDLSENDTLTNIHEGSSIYKNSEIFEELIMPDDPRLITSTDSNTAFSEISDVLRNGDPSSYSSEDILIFDDSPLLTSTDTTLVFRSLDISEISTMVDTTTMKTSEDRNIFDVPEKDCEEGKKRDRRGICRPYFRPPGK